MTRIANEQPTAQHVHSAEDAPKTYLVGAGVASMAAAAFLIRDGDVFGRNIAILEESDVVGGSLDGSGTPETGYVLRGGRMFESKYVCTFELFSSIPALSGDRSVTQEIFDWNETLKTSSKSRLMRDGRHKDVPKFGLSESQILTVEHGPRARGHARNHPDLRPVRSGLLQDRLLVDVVHDLCFPTLA